MTKDLRDLIMDIGLNYQDTFYYIERKNDEILALIHSRLPKKKKPYVFGDLSTTPDAVGYNQAIKDMEQILKEDK